LSSVYACTVSWCKPSNICAAAATTLHTAVQGRQASQLANTYDYSFVVAVAVVAVAVAVAMRSCLLFNQGRKPRPCSALHFKCAKTRQQLLGAAVHQAQKLASVQPTTAHIALHKAHAGSISSWPVISDIISMQAG
jgi:hypothetical protein